VPALPFCDVTFKAPQVIDPQYPRELRSIGDHVRKTRLDRGLLQKQVAAQIGVDLATVRNWERGTSVPTLRVLPRVIDFLGHDPRVSGTTFAEQLRRTRTAQGLSLVEFTQAVDVDPSTLAGWELGQHRPSGRNIERILTLVGVSLGLIGDSEA
jgi:transcriptional regulator with XRE-family HTH domain